MALPLLTEATETLTGVSPPRLNCAAPVATVPGVPITVMVRLFVTVSARALPTSPNTASESARTTPRSRAPRLMPLCLPVASGPPVQTAIYGLFTAKETARPSGRHTVQHPAIPLSRLAPQSGEERRRWCSEFETTWLYQSRLVGEYDSVHAVADTDLWRQERVTRSDRADRVGELAGGALLSRKPLAPARGPRTRSRRRRRSSGSAPCARSRLARILMSISTTKPPRRAPGRRRRGRGSSTASGSRPRRGSRPRTGACLHGATEDGDPPPIPTSPSPLPDASAVTVPLSVTSISSTGAGSGARPLPCGPPRSPCASSCSCGGTRLGPVLIARPTCLAATTVHAVLVRCRLIRLCHIDRVTGEPLRRYEHPTLVLSHVVRPRRHHP